jgi:predicted DNA-binding protein
MTISIRLDPDTEDALRRHLAAEGVALSAFVREAIRDKLAHAEEPSTPYATGAALFGRFASGDSDRSTRRKALIRERVDAKHRR